jgi:hypothetical protein
MRQHQIGDPIHMLDPNRISLLKRRERPRSL